MTSKFLSNCIGLKKIPLGFVWIEFVVLRLHIKVCAPVSSLALAKELSALCFAWKRFSINFAVLYSGREIEKTTNFILECRHACMQVCMYVYSTVAPLDRAGSRLVQFLF